MAWDPYSRAKDATYGAYIENYDPKAVESFRERGRGEPFLNALSNHSVVDRVGIANFLLEQGMDATAVSYDDRINGLHVLFGVREHDFDLEAPLLERILKEGADINLRSPRFGRPLQMLCKMPASDSELAPFFDVFFSRPDIDLELLVRRDPPYTQRDVLLGIPDTLPEFYPRAQKYLSEHPQKMS